MKFFQPSQELVEEHYKDHSKKSFFPELVEFFGSGPGF